MSRFISVLPLSGRTENWQVKCSVSSTVIPTQGDTVRRFTTVIPLRPKKEGQIAFDEVLGVEMEKHVDSDGEGLRNRPAM